jgi:hypothetical protein
MPVDIYFRMRKLRNGCHLYHQVNAYPKVTPSGLFDRLSMVVPQGSLPLCGSFEATTLLEHNYNTITSHRFFSRATPNNCQDCYSTRRHKVEFVPSQ